MHIDLYVQIAIGEDVWSIYRRYSKFRQLHQDMKKKFPEVRGFAVISLTSMKQISSEKWELLVFFAFISLKSIKFFITFLQVSHLIFPPRKLLFSRSDKVVAERRKLLEVLVNFEHVYSTLMLLFALHNLSVNLRERGEIQSPKRDTVQYILYFFYIAGLPEGSIVHIFAGTKL